MEMTALYALYTEHCTNRRYSFLYVALDFAAYNSFVCAREEKKRFSFFFF